MEMGKPLANFKGVFQIFSSRQKFAWKSSRFKPLDGQRRAQSGVFACDWLAV
jgi:hypothetical protein